MIARQGWVTSLLSVAAVGCLGLGATQVAAQGLTPDPYNIVGEYNGQYAPFMYPVQPIPGNPFSNMARLQERAGYRNSNRFQSFVDGFDGAEVVPELPATGRRAGMGTPYYRANRQYDRDFGRVYRPNKSADESFYSALDERNGRYFEAMKEKDPRKRAQLLREYNVESLRSARSLSTPRQAERTTDRALRRPGAETPIEEGDPLLSPARPAARRSRPGSSALPSLVPPPSSSRAGARSLLDPLNAPTRSGSRLPSLEPPPARRSPSDILDESERTDTGTRGVPRRPVGRDAVPSPLDR